jgi:hypothetical protein
MSSAIERAKSLGFHDYPLLPEPPLNPVFLRDGRRSEPILQKLADWANQFRILILNPDGQRALAEIKIQLIILNPELLYWMAAEMVRESQKPTDSS